jgi:molybdopterin-biosynthesis enzyme MoeA-like protein
MAEWVLENRYATQQPPLRERSLEIIDTPESSLVPLMEAFQGRFADLKLYSLPRLGKPPVIELGLRGRGDIDAALSALERELAEAQIPYRKESGESESARETEPPGPSTG